MNKKYLATQNMLFQFNDFITAHKAELESKPVIWELIQLILTKSIEFNEAIGVQSINYGGYTISKNQKKAMLAICLIQIINLLYNDCLKNNKMDDIENFKSTEGKLLNMSYTNLLKYAMEIAKYCDKHTADWAAIGITEAMYASLGDAITAMRTYLPLPQEMRKRREEATKTIKKIAKDIDVLQTERLDKLMESFYKNSNPLLYSAYQQSVRRDKPGSSKMALVGSVMDKRTNKPITHAQILIPKAEIEHIIRGEKGGFRIPNLEAGTFPIEFRAVNYKSQTITLVHNFGATDRLDVFLEPQL